MIILIEFPTIAIDPAALDMGLDDCYVPGTRSINLQDIEGFGSAPRFMPHNQVMDGTLIRYKNADTVWVRVPYEDVRTVFKTHFNNITVHPFTNYLTPTPSVTTP